MAEGQARGRNFTAELPATSLYVEADPGHLRDVLTCLLKNAVHFTLVGGHIWLAAERQGERIVLWVEDDGIGIVPASLPRIFDRCVYGGEPEQRTNRGLGTRLLLVRKLMELQGGTIEAFSEGAEHGSRFTVSLPALPPPSSLTRELGGLARHLLRVLVVDNNAEAAESNALLLAVWGYEGCIAYDMARRRGPGRRLAAARGLAGHWHAWDGRLRGGAPPPQMRGPGRSADSGGDRFWGRRGSETRQGGGIRLPHGQASPPRGSRTTFGPDRVTGPGEGDGASSLIFSAPSSRSCLCNVRAAAGRQTGMSGIRSVVGREDASSRPVQDRALPWPL